VSDPQDTPLPVAPLDPRAPARRNAYVAGFSLLAAMGRAEARDLGLDDEALLYDPQVNFDRVEDKWFDWDSDPAYEAKSTRTIDIPAPGSDIPVTDDSQSN